MADRYRAVPPLRRKVAGHPAMVFAPGKMIKDVQYFFPFSFLFLFFFFSFSSSLHYFSSFTSMNSPLPFRSLMPKSSLIWEKKLPPITPPPREREKEREKERLPPRRRRMRECMRHCPIALNTPLLRLTSN